jgi:hypothetical protein
VEKLLIVPQNYYFDFGYEVLDPQQIHYEGEIEVRPLDAPNLNFNLSVGELLSSLPEISHSRNILFYGDLLEPFQLPNGTRFFPIVRKNDWKDGKSFVHSNVIFMKIKIIFFFFNSFDLFFFFLILFFSFLSVFKFIK